MPARYAYDIKCEARGHVAPNSERFISYMYRIRHDLCNLCHRGMPSCVFCSNLRFVQTVAIIHYTTMIGITLRDSASVMGYNRCDTV